MVKPALFGFLLLGISCLFVADMPTQAQDPELAFDQVVGHPVAFLSFRRRVPGAK